MRTADADSSGWRYLVALGSNVRHHRHGDPRAVLRAALAALDRGGTRVQAASPIHTSAPLGPSLRRYANGAALIVSDLGPPALLDHLQSIERRFGRRPARRWAARVLDLDIVLWSGGRWRSAGLTVPHPEFARRAFVLGPAARLAPGWRDPIGGLSLRQLHARLTRRATLPRASCDEAESHNALDSLFSRDLSTKTGTHFLSSRSRTTAEA